MGERVRCICHTGGPSCAPAELRMAVLLSCHFFLSIYKSSFC